MIVMNDMAGKYLLEPVIAIILAVNSGEYFTELWRKEKELLS
jgi:hypothetical protein